MKKYIWLFSIIIFIGNLYSQVLISPYIVYTDENNKVSNFIVQNETEHPYEIAISFMFGYPVSDSTGQIIMKYFENDSAQVHSINNYIRAFPRKFILPPKKRQIVRITIKAPDTLSTGTYWTRMITSSTPFSEQVDTISNGLTARIKFVLNQVTTCIYRVGNAESGLKIVNSRLIPDTGRSILELNLERIGNSPFIGNLLVNICDENGEVIKELNEYIPVYFDLTKRIYLEHSEFDKGKNYIIKITTKNTEREDIPESKLKIISLPDAEISFKIPAE